MKLQKKKFLLPFFIFLFATSLLNIKPALSAKKTSLRIDPQIIYEPSGEFFKINITVFDAEYLYNWQVNMSFNPSVLEFIDVTEGDFMARQPEGTFGSSRLDHKEDGWVFFGWSTVGEYIGESGSGILATVEFQVLTEGESLMKFETNKTLPAHTFLQAQKSATPPPLFGDIEFTVQDGLFINTISPPVADFTVSESPAVNQSITFDASGSNATSPLEITEYFWDFGDDTNATVNTSTINHTYTTGGNYTVSLTVFDNATVSEDSVVYSLYNTTNMPRIWYELYSTKEKTVSLAFAHDIAVTDVVVSKTEVTPGETVSINVTVMNKGTEPEDFEVTVYYRTYVIDSQQVIDLGTNEEQTLIFSWDTTDIAEDAYQIKAVASTVEEEGNVDNNTFIDGTVTVKAASEGFPTLLIGGAAVVIVVLIVIAAIFMRRKGS